jgi:chemotaxis protein CheD
MRLLPGASYFGAEQLVIESILGSCVAVCLFCAQLKVGAINHALLPALPDGRQDLRTGHYVESSLRSLVDCFQRSGARPSALVAKIVGGAHCVAAGDKIWPPMLSVGERNVEVARFVLADYGIDVVGERTGGTRGRKILYRPTTNELYVKTLIKPVQHIDLEVNNGPGVPVRQVYDSGTWKL